MLNLRCCFIWLVIVIGFAVFLPSAQASSLNDTGITTCSGSDATHNGLPCPVPGFPGQDAEYGSNSFDFTKLDANGNVLPASVSNHTCVRDNVTGLIWEVKTSDGGLRDQKWIYSWYDSNSIDGYNGTASGGICYATGRCDTEKYTQDMNASGLCGFKDWRVPNLKELVGIVDYSKFSLGSVIDTGYFPNTKLADFWSSSPYASYSASAWLVAFNSGAVNLSTRAVNNAVRLVHGGLTFDYSLTDNGDGTVTDDSTGLMWARCSNGQSGTNCAAGSATSMTWAQALTAAGNSSLGGYDDWRLPNIKELQSLVDYGTTNPSIKSAKFPNTPLSCFWSSSPSGYSYAGKGFAWCASFKIGNVGWEFREYSHAVRLVRSGQTLTAFVLSTSKIGNGSGTIASNPSGIDCGTICSASFSSGTAVTLTANPTSGSAFSGWSGDCYGTDTCTVSMTAAKTVTATFTAAVATTYDLSVSKVGNGTVTSNPTGINCGTGSGCSASFNSGTSVTLMANPASGIFSGGCTGTGTCTVSMAVAKNVTATFTGESDDVLQLQHTSPAIVGAGNGNDTYILSPSLLTGTEHITLSDAQGINLLQLVGGLSIAQSEVAATALRLTLTNGAKVTVLGADAFKYDVGGNAAAGIYHTPVTFVAFAQGTLGVTVPTSGTATGGPVTIPNP